MAARPVRLFLSMALFAVATLVGAEVGNAERSDPFTPLGRWRTVDDLTGKINSVVTIWEEDGKLYGRIEWLINPDPNDPDPAACDVPVISRANASLGCAFFGV